MTVATSPPFSNRIALDKYQQSEHSLSIVTFSGGGQGKSTLRDNAAEQVESLGVERQSREREEREGPPPEGPPISGLLDPRGAYGRDLAYPSSRTAAQSFFDDRRAEDWFASQPIRPGESVSDAITRFSPGSLPEETWRRIGAVVRTSVHAAAPHTVYSARALMAVVTQLAVWVDTLGLPIEPEVAFHPDTIDRFATEGCGHLAPGTQLNYRTQLRAVGAVVLGPDLFPPRPLPLQRSDPLAPYSSEEIAALRSWCRGLPTERNRYNVAVVLAFGLGAGLTSGALSRLLGDEVTRDEDGVIVHVIGPRPRDVPVLRQWEDEVHDLGFRAGAPLWSSPSAPRSAGPRSRTSSPGARGATPRPST